MFQTNQIKSFIVVALGIELDVFAHHVIHTPLHFEGHFLSHFPPAENKLN